jgi:hypothetical protein
MAAERPTAPTILIVDDEDSTRNLCRDVIVVARGEAGACGHSTSANGGGAGSAPARDHPAPE